MTLVLDTARDLEAAGFVTVPVHAVGPDGQTCSCPKGGNCKDAGRHPVGDGWQHGTGGAHEIEALLEKRPRINVGVLVEPSGLVVIDIDPRNGGDTTMAALVAEHGRMPETRVVRTGRGGWHYYFRAPEGVRLRGTLGAGIDLKSNGMVVAEGSRASTGGYELYRDRPVAELPGWVVEMARRPDPATPPAEQAAPAPPAARLDETDPDLPRRRSYCATAVAGELERLDKMVAARTTDDRDYRGEPWNSTTFAVACNLFELGNTPETELSADEVATLIRDHAPQDKGFGPEEVEKIIGSARGRVGATSRSVPPQPINPFESALAEAGEGGSGMTALERMDGRLWQDAHVANAFVEHHIDRLRYVPGLGWLRWSPVVGVWRLIDDDAVKGMSSVFAQDLSAGATKTGNADLAKKAAARMGASSIGNVVSLAKGHDGVRESMDALDADPELLNCTNGYVDLRTGALIEHNRDKMMTKVTGCAYNPGVTHPDVELALSALAEDERDWLQLMLGQAITGNPPKEDLLVLLHGMGANGKSAVVSALLSAVGSYGTLVTDQVVLASSNAHTTDMTDLLGVRVGVLEELPSGGNLNSKRVKSIVGTPTMKARRMHENNVEWRASHTMLVTTNHRPKITETDHGLWRRLALLTFPFRFVSSEAEIASPNDRVGDQGLRERLKSGPQREAFLAWVVEGARRYLAMGDQPLVLTDRMLSDRKEWRHGVDPTGRFIEEMVELDASSCIPGADLYEEMKDWLASNGHPPWSSQTAADRFESHPTVQAHDVRKARVTVSARTRISPRPGPVSVSYAPGQKVRVWTGVRWKDEGGAALRSAMLSSSASTEE